MKKITNFLKAKCNLISLANLCAMVLMIHSVNAACNWIHHQPQVPEAAMKYRKF